VSNALGVGTASTGLIEIIDASTDTLSTSTMIAGTNPGMMTVSPALDRTLIFDSGSNDVSIEVNSDESNAAFVTLSNPIENEMPGGLVAMNASYGFAAMPTYFGTGTQSLGAVAALDLVNADVMFTMAVPTAHRMVMNSAATEILVFSDANYACTTSAGTAASALTVLDIVNTSTVSVPPAHEVCGFDHPAWGVFSGDNNTAYIMNCGPECGGTQASVQLLDMTQSPPVPGAAVPVPAATIGFLNGSTLYVAGSPGGATGSRAGALSIFNNVSDSALGAAIQPAWSIGDGFHTIMALGANNKLFVGAINCTNHDPNPATPTGCMSIFDTGANTAVVDNANGYVTGIVPIANRSVVYAVEGGNFEVYDTTTSAVSTTIFINITGQLVDVKAIDQPQ
jgi:hypothetical protein